MASRRELINRIAQPLEALYDPREALTIARLAVAELTGVPLSSLLSDPGAPLEIDSLEPIIAELAAGRPLQYVTGVAEFLGRRFAVREGVLIPRPETEELVTWIVRDCPTARTLLDIGTGSGCIALSLAAELPKAAVFAADIATVALDVAAENSRALGLKITLREADALRNLAEVFPERFDVLVSNPPYVPQEDRRTMHVNVRDYEPQEALFVPGDDPLLFYRAIARAGRQMLSPGGHLYFEIYHLAGDAIAQMLTEEGYTAVTVRDDLNGKPRMVCCLLK